MGGLGKHFIFIALVGLLGYGCAADATLPGDQVALRVHNLSHFTLDEVTVQPGEGGLQRYTKLGPGEVSDYKDFDFTYRYAYIQVVIGQDTLSLQPFDYVGEPRFDTGAFTFELAVSGDDEPAYLTLNFKKD